MNQRSLLPAHAALRTAPVLAGLIALVALAFAALMPPGATGASTPATAQKLYPSISKVTPKKAGIGDRMTIIGKSFRVGKARNTVVFKRTGKRAIFVRANGVSSKKITLVLPPKLLPMLMQKEGVPVPTRFQVRVLAKRFGKNYTALKASPMIGPKPVSTKVAKNDCDNDGLVNAKDPDDDNDLLLDDDEITLGTDRCLRDSDGDGMSDGWEHHSALDRNGKAKPAPTRKPYPNALDKSDSNVDHDGDGLSNLEEYAAWSTTSSKLRDADADPYTSRLAYSGGNPNSDGRRRRADELAYMDRDGNGFLSDFERDADGDGIPNMDEQRSTQDVVRGINGTGSTSTNQTPTTTTTATTTAAAPTTPLVEDPRFLDFGLFNQVYIDSVAAAQSKQAQPRCAGINQVPFYCLDAARPVSKVDTLDWLDVDSDGDSIRDGQDDVDHDGTPNMTEYLLELRAVPEKRNFGHLEACIPNSDSAYCLVGTVDVDNDTLDNRVDDDDDGDGLQDTLEAKIGTDPLVADTDGDGADDGFEYYSALDLNSAAVPYPDKRPYPNALFVDSDQDYDGDSLTLRDENKAWTVSGRGLPLQTYSDGDQCTGPFVAAPADPEQRRRVDMNNDGQLCDDERDVDADGLTNWDEIYGRMTPSWWSTFYEKESAYPSRTFLATGFADADSDGDGVLDGADDEDGDGLSNSYETTRVADWATTYISNAHPGTNALARTNPFNPCKPFFSDRCHTHPPLNYYPDDEDWQAPTYSGPLPAN